MLSDPEIRKVADELDGTSDSVETVLERLELEGDSTDIEDSLLSVGIELCSGCGWWMESTMLDNEDGLCDDCTNEPNRDRADAN